MMNRRVIDDADDMSDDEVLFLFLHLKRLLSLENLINNFNLVFN